MHYAAADEYLQSDHRAVFAVFDLETSIRTDRPASNVRLLSTNRTQVDSKLDVWLNKPVKPELFTNQMRFIQASNVKQDFAESVTDSSEDSAPSRKGWPWIGLFREDFDDLDDYLAYLYVEEMPCNERPPEEILRKKIDEAKEAKEGEPLDEASSSRTDKFAELQKKLEWSKLEFAEQTFTQPGRYVLIYFNGDRSVESISEPIEIVAD